MTKSCITADARKVGDETELNEEYLASKDWA